MEIFVLAWFNSVLSQVGGETAFETNKINKHVVAYHLEIMGAPYV